MRDAIILCYRDVCVCVCVCLSMSCWADNVIISSRLTRYERSLLPAIECA